MNDASRWSVAQMASELRKQSLRAGFPEFFAPRDLSFRFQPKWREAFERALAFCEQEGVDPSLYCVAIVDTMAQFTSRKGIPLVPPFIHSTGTIDRLSRWLSSKESESDSRRRVFVLRTTRETKYIGLLLREFLRSGEWKEGWARRKAFPPRRKRSRRARIAALANVLHEIHPDLPDSLVLQGRWRARDVLEAAMRLVEIEACPSSMGRNSSAASLRRSSDHQNIHD